MRHARRPRHRAFGHRSALVLAAAGAIAFSGGVALSLASAAEPPRAEQVTAYVAQPLPERLPEKRASRSRPRPASLADQAPPSPAALPPAAEPVAPPPPPPPPPAPACESDPAARGARVLATLPDSSWRATGMPVQFSGGRQGMYGEVRTDQWIVHVYVRSCRNQSDAHLRHVIAHELGHAHDVALLSEDARRAYKQARGIAAATPWYGCSGCADLATPAGDYAEVYGQWLRGGSKNKSQLAGDPSAAQLADLAGRFFSLG